MIPRIELDEDLVGYAPGEAIRGTVHWALPAAPRRAELRLGWAAVSKGGTDRDEPLVVPVVAMLRSGAPTGVGDGPYRTIAQVDEAAPTLAAVEMRRFAMTAPTSPWSFRGALIDLTWSLTLWLDGKPAATETVVIAPGRRRVELEPGR